MGIIAISGAAQQQRRRLIGGVGAIQFLCTWVLTSRQNNPKPPQPMAWHGAYLVLSLLVFLVLDFVT